MDTRYTFPAIKSQRSLPNGATEIIIDDNPAHFPSAGLVNDTPAEVTRSPHFDAWSDARPWQKGDRWPSDMEQMIKPQWFKNLPPTGDDPNAWWNKPQTEEREVREQYSLPGHSTVTAAATRKVVELNGQGAGQVHVTTAKAGVHRIKMAGLPSGALTGVIALIEGGVERQVGSGNLDSTDFFTKPMAAGETFTISIDKQGGDDKTELAIEPQ